MADIPEDQFEESIRDPEKTPSTSSILRDHEEIRQRAEKAKAMAGDGLTQREIAAELGVSQPTVNDDLSRNTVRTQKPDKPKHKVTRYEITQYTTPETAARKIQGPINPQIGRPLPICRNRFREHRVSPQHILQPNPMIDAEPPALAERRVFQGPGVLPGHAELFGDLCQGAFMGEWVAWICDSLDVANGACGHWSGTWWARSMPGSVVLLGSVDKMLSETHRVMISRLRPGCQVRLY